MSKFTLDEQIAVFETLMEWRVAEESRRIRLGQMTAKEASYESRVILGIHDTLTWLKNGEVQIKQALAAQQRTAA